MDWENQEQPQEIFNELLEAWKAQSTQLTEKELNTQAATYQLRFIKAFDPFIASMMHGIKGDFLPWFNETGWAKIVFEDLRPRLRQAGLDHKEASRLLTRISLVFDLMANLFNQCNETPADLNAFRQWIEELEVQQFKEDMDEQPTST